MADGIGFGIDAAQLDRDSDRLIRAYLTAGTVAVSTTAKALERKLEAATQAAVPGNLWRAWASESYPKSGPARDPVGTIFINGRTRTRGALTFWTQPGAIRGRSGQYLAIPLPAAGSQGRSRDLTPGEWERRTGVRLRFVYRPGQSSLLVADSGTVVRPNGAYTSFRPITRQRTLADQRRGFTRGETTVPIFVLVPTVQFRNAFSIEAILSSAEADLAAEYLLRVGAIDLVR